MDVLKEAVVKTGDEVLRQDYDKLSERLVRQDLVVAGDLQEYILRPILHKKSLQDGYRSRRRNLQPRRPPVHNTEQVPGFVNR